MHRLIYYYFILSLLFIFLILGFFTHKYKFKYIYTFIEDYIIYFENYFDINLENKLMEIDSPSTIVDLNNQNFKLNNKPKKNFDYALLLKLDHSNFRLMKNPNTAIWNWNLGYFRRPETIMPLKLFPNGDVIVARINNKGIYRINKHGKILWKKNYYFHHWTTDDSTNIFIPSRQFKTISKIKNEEIKSLFNKRCSNETIIFDTILVMNKIDGAFVKEISLLDSIYQSKEYTQKFIQLFEKNFKCENILHLNDVVVLDKKQANYFPYGKEGDLLLSFRQINSIALLDINSNKIKWEFSKNIYRQHSPRVSDNGTVLIFDNMYKRDNNDNEYVSRILEIDIKTEDFVGQFDNFRENFYSQNRGRIQIIDNRLFVQSSSQGEIFEIYCKTKYLSSDCNVKYIFSAIYSDFYDHEVYNIFNEKNDQMYLGDLYKKSSLVFLDEE